MREKLLLFVFLFAIIGTAAHGAGVSVSVSADKSEVDRGGMITYTVTVENSGGALSDLTLKNELSTGLDQWTASYRRDGGDWQDYPPTGLISIGSLGAGATTVFDIKARIELSAPGTISDAATLFDASGPLADGNLVINVLPSVDAGADKMVGLGGTVELGDAAASDGGDGIASYSWSDNGGGGSFSDPNILHPIYTAPNMSSLITLTLTVTDTQGGVNSDSLHLRVDAFPTVDAGADKEVDEGGEIALNDASAADSDGWIVSYRWSDGGAGGSFSPSNQVKNPTYTAPLVSDCAGDDIVLTLTVTDDWGAEASDSLNLHVRNVNSPPTVDAGPDKEVDEGGEIALNDASAADSDGWIVSYRWSDGGAGGSFSPSNQVKNPTYTAPLVSDCAGDDIVLTLTVTDNCGTEASDSLNLHVRNVNSPPTVDAGPDKDVHSGDRVTLSGSATDPDGTIISYAWTQTAGPSVSLYGAASPTLEFTAPNVTKNTVLRFRFTATDDCGGSASDETVVTVSPASSPFPKPAKIEVEKKPDRTTATFGDAITYTYTVRNSGEETLYDVSLEDDRLGPITLPTTVLAPGESASATASTTVTEDDFPGPLVNTVTATARTTDGRTVSDQAQAQVELTSGNSGVMIEIKALDSRGFPLSPLSPLTVGDTITYVYRVTNTGKVPLNRISVVDDPLGPVPIERTELAPWESTEGRLTRTVTEKDLPGPISDTGTATAYDPLGNRVIDSATITLLEISGTGGIRLTKEVNTDQAVVGDTLIYTYTIENTGNVTITDLVLTDDRLGEIPLPRNVLFPGESMTVTATYTVTADDLPGPLTNHASVSGEGAGGEVRSDVSTVSVTITGIAGGGGGAVGSPCDGKVIISEVAWAGTPSDSNAEWIELENLGETPVDLTGWKIGWYPSKADPSDESVWTWIPLSGTISPAPTSPCTNPRRRPPITFVKEPGNDLGWKVIDMAWWVAGKDGNEGRGYYLLERGSDEAVSDVTADLVYDAPLPDDGAVIELVNSAGEVVDTANAGSGTGWAAGDPRTEATMERTDPLGPDTSDNWHTNPGILVYGTDSAGDRLVATAGKPNSPDLETLISLAEEEVTPVTPHGPISLTLDEGWKTRPWVKVAAVGITAAGGGGAAPKVTLSSARGAGGYSLQLDPQDLAPGSYFIWITGAAGEAILVPVTIED